LCVYLEVPCDDCGCTHTPCVCNDYEMHALMTRVPRKLVVHTLRSPVMMTILSNDTDDGMSILILLVMMMNALLFTVILCTTTECGRLSCDLWCVHNVMKWKDVCTQKFLVVYL